MAPEVICRRNHSYTADYFAVGVMAYEFMLGKRPYVGKNRKEIRDQILSKQAAVKAEELPSRWSFEAIDFINKVNIILLSYYKEIQIIGLELME
jgi:serine/threonine protein kinase